MRNPLLKSAELTVISRLKAGLCRLSGEALSALTKKAAALSIASNYRQRTLWGLPKASFNLYIIRLPSTNELPMKNNLSASFYFLSGIFPAPLGVAEAMLAQVRI